MTTIICLHGFASSPELWRGLTPPPMKAEAILLPGHGGSAFPAEIPLPQRYAEPAPATWRAAASWLISKAPDHKAVWTGYSLGARLALAVAAYAPERVAALVLFGGHAGLLTAAERQSRAQWEEPWAQRIATDSPDGFADAWEQLPIFASQHHIPVEVRQRQRAWRTQHMPAALAQAFRAFALSTMPDWRPTISALMCPIWLAPGVNDAPYVAQAKSLQALNPLLVCSPVGHAGHNPPLQNPMAAGELLAQAHKAVFPAQPQSSR
jgi:2-succinyl-6-hydroxy-2,4-cyclohexadiene-1-carboxylate synthase